MVEQTYFDINGFYEPNWFYMFISGIPPNLELDFDRFNDQQNGLYLHEYGHYLQNINTLSGVLNAIEYYKYTHNIRARSGKLDSISLPITDDPNLISDYEIKRRERFRLFRGDYYNLPGITDFDGFEMSTHYEIEGEMKGTQKVSFYKKNVLIQQYNFGNLAVKEGMSRALQMLFDDKPDHPFYPYKLVECLINQYCPKISSDNVKIAAICSLALNFENAGHHFYRLIIEYNETDVSMEEFIQEELSRKLNVSDGSNLTIKEMTLRSIEELRSTIHLLLGTKIRYIDDLFDNIITIEANNDLLFYDILSSNSPLIEKLNVLKGYYGVPLIQLDDFSLIFPVSETNSGVAEELVEFMSIKAMLDRLFETNGVKRCRYIPFCDRNQEFLTDKYCDDKQWMRETECPFTQMLEYWGIKDKLPK